MWKSAGAAEQQRDFLSHWSIVLPILLLAAALSLRQIDLYPPTTDEFYSLYSSGWVVNSPFSPLDVIESLRQFGPDHVPGYFLLLSAWGNLVSYDLAIGRVLSIFCGLLSIAMIYRLARDFVAPAAASFAIIILASNAFYNYYYAHVRMYSLFVLMAGVVIWLYLRILETDKAPSRKDCLALGAAGLFSLSIHLFSIVFLLPIAIFHLLFAPRGPRWLAITLTGAGVFLLSAPWLVTIIANGLNASADEMAAYANGNWEILYNCLMLIGSGNLLLLAVSFAGIALAVNTGHLVPKSILMLVALQVLAIGIFHTAMPDIIGSTTGYRFLLPAFLPSALLMGAGIYYLYRYRRIFGILAVFWLVAGINFQSTAHWRQFIGGLDKAFSLPPWQVIARLAAEERPSPPLLIAINTPLESFSYNRRIPYSQRMHYFAPRGIELLSITDLPDLALHAANRAIDQRSIWILHEHRSLLPEDFDYVRSNMNRLDYDLCETIHVGASWSILAFYWDILECGDIEPASESRNAFINLQFYNARLSANGSRLYFVDSWSAAAQFSRDNFGLSYQLITTDWGNVAQLDLPLVHEGALRRFFINVDGVPPGSYRLMIILYDKQTGERIHWIDNPGDLPSMMELTEVILPE
ncbi:MAG: glycosyltransferase family 39 protein [Chloroflexi bacterium]|nr:glycosyltransferase family 39 protein [Chloroflexota bacterium]